METVTTNSGNDINNEEHSPMLISSSSNCLITTINNHSNQIATPNYEKQSERFLTTFSTWDDHEQLIFVENLLQHMQNHQHAQVNTFLLPMLQRDFIGQLATRGLEHIAEKILGYLDNQSLISTELVCHDWYHVISSGIL
jgi:F-box and WD-40 domain protein 1/11